MFSITQSVAFFIIVQSAPLYTMQTSIEKISLLIWGSFTSEYLRNNSKNWAGFCFAHIIREERYSLRRVLFNVDSAHTYTEGHPSKASSLVSTYSSLSKPINCEVCHLHPSDSFRKPGTDQNKSRCAGD